MSMMLLVFLLTMLLYSNFFLLISLVILIFLFSIKHNFFFFNFFFNDELTSPLIILTLILMMSIFFIVHSAPIVLLVCFMAFFFASTNFLVLYMFFELSVFPIFFIILSNGKQYERLEAGFHLMFYTLFGSIPLLLTLVSMKNYGMEWMMEKNFMYSNSFYLLLYLAFLVKMPMYLFHSWLLKAHVEAPVYGSMILAGVMLKLGGYGLMKFIFYFPNLMIFLKNFMVIPLYGAIISSFYCLVISDLKTLVAMSSVSHMSLMVCSLMTMTLNSKTACIWLMLSHGYSSSGLFFILNNLYMRSMSRSIFLCKNNFSYYMKFWLILLCFMNLPAPPSANFISEIMIFFSILMKNNFAIIFFATYFLTSSAYSMYLYYSISSYSVNMKYSSSPLTMSEVNILFIHIFFSFVSFMFMSKLV